METILLLGSNLGDREKWLNFGCTEISCHLGNILKKSSIYETAAWGDKNLPAFLNQAIIVETALSTYKLLSEIHKIEGETGRSRTAKWMPRQLDIDILMYGAVIMNENRLMIPHPYMHLRRFTLEPVVEIAAEYVHPVFGVSISALLKNCEDPLEVNRLNKVTKLKNLFS